MMPITLDDAVKALATKDLAGRNLQMSGEPRYQPALLKPYLGYDQRAGWQVIASWFWLEALASEGIMPAEDAAYLTPGAFFTLISFIDTTKVDETEKKTGHDVLALLSLMRSYMPEPLHRWLHYGCTSYDIISTAYALMWRETYEHMIYPLARRIDVLWRKHIAEQADTFQNGRTHLQVALPVTVGCWLAVLHDRFFGTALRAREFAQEIPGKFSGAVGTSAAIRAFAPGKDPQATALEMLKLPDAMPTTQITQQEAACRFFHELTLLSGVLANLGLDVRQLQSTEIGELKSASSTSSTMSHKTANPIAAENIEGMHASVIGAFTAVSMTHVSTLQRDLRWSNVMRSFDAILVFTTQQLLAAERILKSMVVDRERCAANMARDARLVTAEILHLALQREGLDDAHAFVNKEVVPCAQQHGILLDAAMDMEVARRGPDVQRAWEAASPKMRHLLQDPTLYIGDAVDIARLQADKELPE